MDGQASSICMFSRAAVGSLMSIRGIVTRRRFSTMKTGPNVKDRKNVVVSLVTRCRLFKMAANLHIMPYNYMHTALFLLSSSLLPIFNVINIWRSKAVSTPLSPSNPNSPHTIPQHPIPTPTSPNMLIMSSCLYLTVLLTKLYHHH